MANSSLLPVADYGTTPRQSTSEGRPNLRASTDINDAELTTKLLQSIPQERSALSRKPILRRRTTSWTPESSPERRASNMGGPEELGLHDSQSGLTLFEKKCLIINREMDRFGMGKYQWYVWILCGFGYLLDLMWAQAFGLVLQPLHQELGFPENQSGNITASFNAGLTAGAAVWGILVDIVGRKIAFNCTVIFATVFGLGLGGSNSYTTFLVLTAFVGFGVGGNIPIDTTITLEFIPQNSRRLLPFLSIFQPIGVVVTTALAYAFIPRYGCKPDFLQPPDVQLPSCNLVPAGQPCCSKDQNMGWRYLLFTVGAITGFIFICRTLLFNFQESPKYYIYRGQDAKAAKVIQHIAKFNGTTTEVTAQTFESLEEEDDSMGSGAAMIGSSRRRLKRGLSYQARNEGARYAMLFNSWSMARLTLLVWLIYMCDYWGFTVAGAYVPSILAAKNAAAADADIKATYRSYVYIYTPGILGVLLGVACYDLPRVGRKYTMVVSSALMAVSLFVFTTVNDYASNIGLNVMEYFFQSMFNSVLYGWTPEAFAAPIRGTACGIASFWGRLFGIVGPLAAQTLLSTPPTVSDYNRIVYMAASVTLGCVVFTLLLPGKKIGGVSM